MQRFVVERGRERHRRLPPARPAERRHEPARGGRGDHRRGQGVPRRASSTAPAARARRRRSSSRRASSRTSARRACRERPDGRARPHRVAELVERIAEASGLPVGLYCQGAVGTGLAAALAATRAGADLIACAVYPLALTLHRVSARRSPSRSRARQRDGRRHRALWEACDLVDEHIGDEPVTPLAPRIAVRAAEHDLPAGLVAALDLHLRAQAAGDRLLEVLEEVRRVREEAGWPPLAAPIGQILASQALVNVLSAQRYGAVVDEFRGLVQGRYGSPPAADRRQRGAGRRAAHRRRAARRRPADRRGRARRGGGPRRERGGARAAGDVRRRGRDAAALDPCAAHAATTRCSAAGSRRRAPSGSASSSGSCRRAAWPRSRSRTRACACRCAAATSRCWRSPASLAATPATSTEAPVIAAGPPGVVRVESPMVGTFYRAPARAPRRSSRSATS